MKGSFWVTPNVILLLLIAYRQLRDGLVVHHTEMVVCHTKLRFGRSSMSVGYQFTRRYWQGVCPVAVWKTWVKWD